MPWPEFEHAVGGDDCIEVDALVTQIRADQHHCHDGAVRVTRASERLYLTQMDKLKATIDALLQAV